MGRVSSCFVGVAMEGCGLSLRGFGALIGGGLLAFEWRAGGLNTLLLSRKRTVNLGAGGGLGRAKKLGHTLHIITGRFNDPHSTISIDNVVHMVHNTGTHWDEEHIGKSAPVLRN